MKNTILLVLALGFSVAFAPASFAGKDNQSFLNGKPFASLHDEIVTNQEAIADLQEVTEDLQREIDQTNEVLAELGLEVGALEVRVRTNEGNIVNHETRIQSLEGEISDLEERVAANEGDIALHFDLIEALQEMDRLLSKRLDDLVGEVKVVRGDLADLGILVTVNTGKISANSTLINELGLIVDQNSTNIGKLQLDVDQNTGAIQANVVLIGNNAALISDNYDLITANLTTLGIQATDIANVLALTTTNGQKIEQLTTQLNNALANHQTQLNTLGTQITNLSGRVTDQIAAHQADIQHLQSQTNVNSQDLALHNQRITANLTSIVSLNAQLANLNWRYSNHMHQVFETVVYWHFWYREIISQTCYGVWIAGECIGVLHTEWIDWYYSETVLEDTPYSTGGPL